MSSFMRRWSARWTGSARWLGPTVVFAVSLVVFGIVFHSLPVLYDTDSYYHLAIARAYDRHGIIDTLPWARFSLLNELGDKEFLFHLLLAPFGETADPTAGGRWALALLNAILAAALAFLGFEAVGRWGLLAPVLIYGGSIDFLGRLIRLRPEILSLLLMLAAVWCASRGRYRLLGVVAMLYALSYTAVHAFLGLTFAWFVQQWWSHGRRLWALPLYSILGVAVGLVVHPHFPQNLVVWKVQSVDFFQQKAFLNVGSEIGAHSAPDLLWLNLAWIVGLWAWWSAYRFPDAGGTPALPASDALQTSDAGGTPALPASENRWVTADLLWVTTGIFGILYVMMLRFSVYFIPFATLAVLFEIGRRGGQPVATLRLPWRQADQGGWHRIHVAIPIVAALLLGMPRTVQLLDNLSQEGGPVSRETEWQAFGESLPPGARVAAEWGSTHIYMFWAPQATFLNVLDPVFMNVRFPEAYRALRGIFEAREPDVPLALKAELDSDYIALSRFHQPPSVLKRLDADPRLRARYQGYTMLYELVPDANRDFVLDWRIVPEGMTVPPPAEDVADFPIYPRAPTDELRALEGYVDGHRAGDTERRCVAMVHELESTSSGQQLFELAADGLTSLWMDSELQISAATMPGPYPGSGLTVPIQIEPGSHRMTVLTCRGAGGRLGFYLRRLS